MSLLRLSKFPRRSKIPMTQELRKLNIENLESADSSAPLPRRRSRKGKFSSRLIKWLILLVVAVGLLGLWMFSSPSTNVVKKALTGGSQIKQTDGRVNILLLGIGGGAHDGPNLTDSIIIASYDLKSKNVTMFSIPRDLWLDNIHEKVNAAYQIGLSNGQGLSFTEDKIDDILGIPIHYAVVIDFSGFAKAVDLVGGVDVNVPDTFDDYEYPIDGKENDLCGHALSELPDLVNVSTISATQAFPCRYEHLHFDEGKQHMDGETALKFVRSRHGTGVEGSDFARSRRQQLVIQSFREKLLSAQTVFNPKKIASLIDAFGKSINTDIPSDQFLELYGLVKSEKTTNNVVLGDLGDGKSLFINPPVDQYGAWVLIPPNNDFNLVANFVKTTLASDSAKLAK